MILFRSLPYDDVDGIADLGKVILIDSNVAEDATHAEWNSGTAYVIGNIVKLAAQHKLYEAVSNNTNKNPVTFLGVDWIEAGATNRWKAFDQSIQSQTIADVSDITYELQLNSLCTAVSLFNLSGNSVTVRVYDDPMTILFEETVELIDTTALVDWFEYFYAETTPQTEVNMTGIPGYTGYTMEIEIEGAASPAAVGEIAIGKQNNIGKTILGGQLGLVDFSTVETDVFGNVGVIRRNAAKTVDFPLVWPSSDTRRIEKILESVRGYPAVFISNQGQEAFGMVVYGYYQTYDITIQSRNVTFGTVEVRSLT